MHSLKMKSQWWCGLETSSEFRLNGWPYLGEVADEVATFAVILGQDVEKEGLHIIVEGLVVQEQLGQQTQVLTVDCAHISINLLEGVEGKHTSVQQNDSKFPK